MRRTGEQRGCARGQSFPASRKGDKVLILLFLLLNGLVTYVVVRITVKALLDEERGRWLAELREACGASGRPAL